MKNSIHDPEIKQWLEIRKAEGLKIDPETAEVDWYFREIFDQYALNLDIPEECQSIVRAYFARSPDSEIWVSFSDLPEATRNRLWEKHGRKLAFLVIPAGLEDLSDALTR